MTSFNGNGFNAPSDPATKTPPNCYLIATVTNGQFVRSPDNPPITGSTHGLPVRRHVRHRARHLRTGPGDGD